MSMNIRIIKRRAGSILGSRMGGAVLGMFAVFLIQMAGSFLASSLFAGTDLWSLILYQVFLFIVSLITAVFSAGLSYMYLNMAREKEYSLVDLLYFFRSHPDRVIVASFVMAVLNMLVSIPYYYYGFTAVPGESLEAQTNYLITITALLLLSQVLYIVVTIPLAMTYYLLADDLELEGMAALKASMQLMRGHIKTYILLLLSFVPWMILSVFTLYLGLIWLIPHMHMSETVFYLYLCAEKKREAETESGSGTEKETETERETEPEALPEQDTSGE